MRRLFTSGAVGYEPRPILSLSDGCATHICLPLTLLLAAGCVQSVDPSEVRQGEEREAIVGGADTSITTHPWQVFLRSRSGGGAFCGGSIIEAQWILTAAHCVDGTPASALAIVAGTTRQSQAAAGQVREVTRVVVVPGYVDPSRGRDIALLELSAPLDLSTTRARAIPIVSAEDVSAGRTSAGVNAIVTGWGTLRSGGPSPDILQAATVPIVSNTEANRAYSDINITSDQLAAGRLGVGGVDSCQGDSGGPLTVPGVDGQRRLAGVVSWGYGCADFRFPGMYARVSSYRDWIAQYVGAPASPNPPGGSETCRRQASAGGLPLPIPDNDASGVRARLNFAEGGEIQALNISLAVQHTYRGDLVIDLISPAGARLRLSDRAGGAADNFVLNAARINTLSGAELQGEWQLELKDLARLDLGSLQSWALEAEVGCQSDSGGSGPWRAEAQPDLPTIDSGEVCDNLEVGQDGNSAEVQLDVRGVHSWPAALRATLSHQGRTVEVFSTGSFPRGQGPFELSGRSVAGFSGNARGTWTLCVVDTDAYGDVGTLASWSVYE